ncbi:MAG: hypothetical protein AAFQ22_02935 [Pseudomonadota bacterium]
MTWLLTQMWALLGAAAFIALIFGWAVRGALLRGRLRRSEVEAGLARTELEQARTEIEGLYAAQRKLGEGAGGVDLSGDLAERDQRITALDAEVTSLRGKLEEAQAAMEAGQGQGGNEAAYAAVVGAAGVAGGAFAQGQLSGAAEAQPDAQADALQSEISALQEQVSSLQAELQDAKTLAETQANEIEAQTTQLEAHVGQAVAEAAEATSFDATVPAAVAAPVAAADTVETDKLRWQNDYLRTRLKVFEQKAGVQLSGEPPAGPEDVPAEETAPDAETTAIAAASDDRETPDEELARLRWRNRYLEGRLAYLEEERSRDGGDFDSASAADLGAVPASPDPDPVQASEGIAAEPAVADVVEAAAPLEEQPVADTVSDGGAAAVAGTAAGLASEAVKPFIPAEVQDAGTQAEPASTHMPQVAGDQVAPVPAVEDVNPERPLAIERPQAPDDLTQIEGIGPRIQDVLNSIGVFSFSQIAEWSAGNEAWVDDYLSFSGRVRREDWVDQAKQLTAPNSPTA